MMYKIVCPECKSEEIEIIKSDSGSYLLKCSNCMDADEVIPFEYFNVQEWVIKYK